MELNDSLFNTESQKTLNEFQVLYESEKKDNEIRLLSNEKEIQSIQIKRVRQQRLIFLLIAFSLLLVAFLLWILFEDRKKSSRILDQKNQELNILNSTKDRFISILAHDLKNPFSAFCNITTALKENFDDLDKGEHRYYIDELNESALRMNSMLKNMLDWATIQMKPMFSELVPVDLFDAADSINKSLAPFARSRSVILENNVPEGLVALGNQGAIQTVLNNLISNAIKFSPAHSVVTISGFAELAGVTLTVKDQGMGMTGEDLSKLFRIDKDTRSIGKPEGKGTGLGLILCKELIDKMGGSIGVKSTPGLGTEFFFNLKDSEP
jgi:signal transduction histidine kinase